eukprot:289982-Amphidinium_carterae.1
MRSRHWSIRAWKLREAVRSGEISVSYISTGEQRADSLTKSLSCQASEDHRSMMGLRSLSDEASHPCKGSDGERNTDRRGNGSSGLDCSLNQLVNLAGLSSTCESGWLELNL